jgi:hypothetical protein
VPPGLRELGGSHVGQVAARQQDPAGGRPAQAAGQVQQRGLARAAGAHDGDKLAGADAERYLIQRYDGRRPGPEDATGVVDVENGGPRD